MRIVSIFRELMYDDLALKYETMKNGMTPKALASLSLV